MQRSFFTLTGLSPVQKVVEIGAADSYIEPQYAALLASENASYVGFEPDAFQFAHLVAKAEPRKTYLPCAIGDGNKHTLHVCTEPGLTSLLEPDQDVLKLFHEFPAWGVVKNKIAIETVRLDDVKEARGATFLQLDIQGAELMALQHAEACLKTTCAIHVEVEFLPLYKDQPLFWDIGKYLQTQGFAFHQFCPLTMRPIAPLVIDNNPRRGLNQIVWADAVFVRDFSNFANYTDDQLVTTAAIMHDCYRSIDLAWRLLIEYDRRCGATTATKYFGSLTNKAA